MGAEFGGEVGEESGFVREDLVGAAEEEGFSFLSVTM